MKHYIDITLLPSDDIGVHFLWSKVMMQVHLALVEVQDSNEKVPVAVSFPQYREKSNDRCAFIGNKLRLMAANKSDLERLDIAKWLNRLEDYLHIKSINEIDQSKVQGYESFGRFRKPANVDYMIRRRMKGLNKSYEEASAHFANFKVNDAFLTLPFIQLKSLKSGHDFRLTITNQVADAEPEGDSVFNTYGLNKNAVLPKF